MMTTMMMMMMTTTTTRVHPSSSSSSSSSWYSCHRLFRCRGASTSSDDGVRRRKRRKRRRTRVHAVKVIREEEDEEEEEDDAGRIAETKNASSSTMGFVGDFLFRASSSKRRSVEVSTGARESDNEKTKTKIFRKVLSRPRRDKEEEEDKEDKEDKEKNAEEEEKRRRPRAKRVVSIEKVPVVGSIARAIKSRRVNRIPIPVVGTFSELYGHAEIASMNDWEEEDVKEYFKARGEEVRVLEVPSIDQRVIVAVNDREKRITVSLRGTKTLVNAAQNLRLMTSAPKFGNNNISLGGSGSIDDTEQQQRRFPTIKFPMMTDARRKELFEEFPDFNVKMHRGYRTIALVVKREVNQFLKDGYDVDLQGHSLGGACALALALLYHHEGRTKVRRVVTFGSPKLGPKDTRDAAEKAGLKILRVVQKDDIFPFLPMSRPGVTRPYVHCGEGIYLDSDQPGKFAVLPTWYGGSGILWRQKAIVTEAYKTSLKKRNEELRSADYDTVQTEKLNVPRIGPRNEKIAHWVKRIRRQRFLKARQTLFSFANEDYDLADALGREEIQDLSAMRSGSFDEDDTKLMKESKMDIVNLSNKERRLESKMTVGPTIFERLRDLQKFDQKERVRRLECHRMVRYREEIKSLMDAGPQQVNLNDMFDDLYTNFRERKNNATNDDAATNAATDSTDDNNDITSDWAEASKRPR